MVDRDHNPYLSEQDPSAWLVATDDVETAKFAKALGATTALTNRISDTSGVKRLKQLLAKMCTKRSRGARGMGKETGSFHRRGLQRPSGASSLRDFRSLARTSRGDLVSSNAAVEAERLFPLDSKRRLYTATPFQQCTMGNDVGLSKAFLGVDFPGECQWPLVLGANYLTRWLENFVQAATDVQTSEAVRFWLNLAEFLIYVIVKGLVIAIQSLQNSPSYFFDNPLVAAIFCIGDFSAAKITTPTRQIAFRSADNLTALTDFHVNVANDLSTLYNITNGGELLFGYNLFPVIGGQYLHLKPSSTWTMFAFSTLITAGPTCQFIRSRDISFILGLSFCSDDYLPSIVLQANGAALACMFAQPEAEAATVGASGLVALAAQGTLDQLGVGFSTHNAFERQLIIYDGVSLEMP
jgi:hypothetical protein